MGAVTAAREEEYVEEICAKVPAGQRTSVDIIDEVVTPPREYVQSKTAKPENEGWSRRRTPVCLASRFKGTSDRCCLDHTILTFSIDGQSVGARPRFFF